MRGQSTIKNLSSIRLDKEKITIIAEAGVNHNGDIKIARQLIDAASKAGADFVKFQTFKTEYLVSKEAKKAEYQAKNVKNSDLSQFGMLKNLEMSEQMHLELLDYCKKRKIGFLSTAFDEESADFLETLELSFFKIPSGEVTNKPYLQHIARKQKPVILSTGMADMDEIEAAIEVITAVGLPSNEITILHCNTQYPTPYKDVNLMAMKTIHEKFGMKVGYSDHTLGIEVSVAAAALGASVIEKHFTLDRNLPGPDHKASLEPSELRSMVSAIRNVELAISGDGVKHPSESEAPNIPIARKSLHLKRNIKKGDRIGDDDLIALRPGDGISPMLIDQIIGRVVIRELSKGSKIAWSDLQ